MNITSQVDVLAFSARPKVDVDFGGRVALHFMTSERNLFELAQHIVDNLRISDVEALHRLLSDRIRAESW